MLAGLALALAASCGDSDRMATPSAPTAVPAARPAIVVAVPSAPLEVVRSTGASGKTAHALTVEVSFKETAGTKGRIVRLALSVVDEAGPLAPVSLVTLDLEVPALGSARHEVHHTFELDRPAEEARWRVAASGLDASGVTFDPAPVEVPIRFPAAPVAAPAVTFVGAGDIASCGSPHHEATARLLDATPGVVFTLGDNVYPLGTPQNYRDCYGPSWGRHRARTRPILGNHDRGQDNGAAYYDYFGEAAGPRGLGYYSFDLGAWHVLALNSELHGNAGSPQHEWVRSDLAATRAACILAYWHHPRYSSGPNGNSTTMKDIWRLLQQAGAELVLSGHDHCYERFSPQDADGRLDTARGIRQFVVGTGGYDLYDQRTVAANSEVRDDRTWGVLVLTLHPTSYDWEFVPAAGQSFRDSGRAACSR